MKRGRFSEEQIIAVLREHGAGGKTAELARKHGISEATLYNWMAKYGGLEVSDAKRLRTLETQIEKAHERYAVADQVLSPIVREIVERLQHQDLELQDRVIGLAAGVAIALLGLRLRHGLDVSTEILPWHELLDRCQRIAQGANRLQPALNIEKALLPHDPLAPSAHDRARSPSQIRGDLARGIFRGALPPCGDTW